MRAGEHLRWGESAPLNAMQSCLASPAYRVMAAVAQICCIWGRTQKGDAHFTRPHLAYHVNVLPFYTM